jgi:hypothetical protein
VYKASNEALYANAEGLLPDPALSGKLAWKMAMTWDPIYFISLPAASASSFNLYGSADSHILKVSAAEAATLVVPFDVAEAKIPEGVKVYNLTFDGTDIKATEVNEIKANKPVLINAPEGEYRLEVYNDSGSKVSEEYFDIEYSNIFFSNGQIIVYSDSDMIIYSNEGAIKYEGSFDQTVKAVIPTSIRSRFLLVTENAIYTMDLK